MIIPIHDALGVAIDHGDTVTVIAYGAPVRVADVGRRATVVGFTTAGNIIVSDTAEFEHDPTAGGRAIRPSCVAVARRDGAPGHQGNATTTSKET